MFYAAVLGRITSCPSVRLSQGLCVTPTQKNVKKDLQSTLHKTEMSIFTIFSSED